MHDKVVRMLAKGSWKYSNTIGHIAVWVLDKATNGFWTKPGRIQTEPNLKTNQLIKELMNRIIYTFPRLEYKNSPTEEHKSGLKH